MTCVKHEPDVYFAWSKFMELKDKNIQFKMSFFVAVETLSSGARRWRDAVRDSAKFPPEIAETLGFIATGINYWRLPGSWRKE